MIVDAEHLDVHALEALKRSERDQIAADLRAGVKSPAQTALEHQPYGQLGARAVMRLDLARQLS